MISGYLFECKDKFIVLKAYIFGQLDKYCITSWLVQGWMLVKKMTTLLRYVDKFRKGNSYRYTVYI